MIKTEITRAQFDAYETVLTCATNEMDSETFAILTGEKEEAIKVIEKNYTWLKSKFRNCRYDTLRRIGRANGTGYKGRITTNYLALVRVFGMPHRYGEKWKQESDGKTQAEWAFQLGTMIITIYDYKEKVDMTDVTEWHIGSKSPAAQVLGFVNRELQRAGQETKISHMQEHGKNQ